MHFSIISPTTGNPLLTRLLKSLNDLEVPPPHTLTHILVIDGPVFRDRVRAITDATPSGPKCQRHILELPFNTGKDGYLGHKIYAAVSQIAEGDYILFLDEDNAYDKRHLRTIIDLVEKEPYEWVYTLRTILLPGAKDKAVAEDLCESLGFLHPVFYDKANQDFLVDTNCFCIRRDILVPCSPIWNRVGTNSTNDPDRLLSRFLLHNFPRMACTKQATLLYQTGNRKGSVQAKFFLEGNRKMLQMYKTARPWEKPMLYVAHFDVQQTKRLLERLYPPTDHRPNISWNQWQLNLCDRLTDHFWVKSAYDNPIPSGSVVLIHMCHPSKLPAEVIKRADIVKVLTTIESPNTRHRDQWALPFLRTLFTHVITYWQPILQIMPTQSSYFPFVGNIDLLNHNDMALVDSFTAAPRPPTVAIVLENRPFRDEFIIEGIEHVKLHALDHLRQAYALALGKVCHAYGNTWKPHEGTVEYHQTAERFLDKERVVDLLAQHSFSLILENTDAEGYASEKIYDAWTAGCIPLYHGNLPRERLQITEDAYVDIKLMTPQDLAGYVRAMDTCEITRRREFIVQNRKKWLSHSSIDAYARHVKNIASKA